MSDRAPSLRLEMDCDSLAANWRALDQLSGAASAGAAVKADCYGLGAHLCVPVLRDAGARHFFVAHWSEVEAVAAHVAPGQISVLHGPLTREDAQYARASGVVPVINSLEQARRWSESGGGVCDLMVDTGINRLGIAPAQIADPAIEALDIRIVMSHLACADEDSATNTRQLESFRSILPQIAHQSASLANSAGIALGGGYSFDITRPGLALYGGKPRAELAGVIRQVARPMAALIQIRTLEAGDSVGYNARFTAQNPIRTGVVSLGYADGVLRAWAGGHLLHQSASLPLLGTISMDMVVIDLTEAPQLKEGDWVELPYDLPTASTQSGLSQYELLTVLGKRFDRRIVNRRE